MLPIRSKPAFSSTTINIRSLFNAPKENRKPKQNTSNLEKTNPQTIQRTKLLRKKESAEKTC